MGDSASATFAPRRSVMSTAAWPNQTAPCRKRPLCSLLSACADACVVEKKGSMGEPVSESARTRTSERKCAGDCAGARNRARKIIKAPWI